jgi:hypothetical protein
LHFVDVLNHGMISPGALADRFWDPTGTFPAVWPVQVAYIALLSGRLAGTSGIYCIAQKCQELCAMQYGIFVRRSAFRSPLAFNAFAIALT